MFDCTTNAYATLYERWLDEPGKLLDLAGLRHGDRVIDLCGGAGIVAKEAVKRGARTAFVVDLNPGRVYDDGAPDDMRIIPPFWGRAEDVDKLIQAHIDILHGLTDGKCLNDVPGRVDSRTCRCVRFTPDFDLVVCRQAIGYLDIDKTARAVSNILRTGGRFVFNTFKRPKWGFKTYVRHGRRFFEASGFFGHTVFHVQALIKPLFGVDVTKFHWHTEDDLDRALRPFFEISKSSSKTGLYYVCTKRGRA